MLLHWQVHSWYSCDCIGAFEGFLPVWLASHILDTRRWMFAFVLCAPVAGHAFPLFYPKRGGKAIAVSFGVLLGLLPRYRPVLLLIFFYLLFSFFDRCKAASLQKHSYVYTCFL